MSFVIQQGFKLLAILSEGFDVCISFLTEKHITKKQNAIVSLQVHKLNENKLLSILINLILNRPFIT